MRGWLDGCESVCCPAIELLSADKVKLRNELQHVQVKSIMAFFLSHAGFDLSPYSQFVMWTV